MMKKPQVALRWMLVRAVPLDERREEERGSRETCDLNTLGGSKSLHYPRALEPLFCLS